MCYIDDIKSDIKQICYTSPLNMKYLQDKVLSRSACDFIKKVNRNPEDNNKYFIYKQITLTTKNGNIYNIAWNFRKEFPIFIISKLNFSMKKYLNEDFCFENPTMPEDIDILLKSFKEQYLPDEKVFIK